MPGLSPYEEKVLLAFHAVCKINHEKGEGMGASAHEVCQHMDEAKTLAEMDTVIDIADIMRSLADRGLIGARQ